jgi:hypothetical protein
MLSHDGLHWLPERGVGYYPVRAAPYDAAYWDRYRAMDKTDVGRALTRMRLSFVLEHYDGQLVDVGVGGGAFVEAAGAHGFDVNPCAIEWLAASKRWHPLYEKDTPAATFWDSFEHINDITAALRQVRRWVFMSLPIFDGPDHVLRSKHYRKDEHYWYWTRAGLAQFMESQGFLWRKHSLMEQSAGRQDIESFSFERVEA